MPLIDFFVGIDADVEVVVQQIVVGAISAVFAAQDVAARRSLPAGGLGPQRGHEGSADERDKKPSDHALSYTLQFPLPYPHHRDRPV